MRVDLAPDLEAVRRIAAGHGVDGGIGLRRVSLGADVLELLPESVARVTREGRVVILEDATSMRIGYHDLKQWCSQMLPGSDRVVLGPPDGRLHADSAAIEVAAAAAAGAGCLVSVGSGTVTDVAKEASRLASVPLVAVQTAASVNGYADGMAVILKDGVKRTVPSAWPVELLVDTRVLVDAPQVLTRSGFAEMMAMFTAPADWQLAAALGLDAGYDPEVIGLFRDDGDDLLAAAPGIAARDPGALQLLALLLTRSGLAMGAVGRTAPLSGTEHVISHLLDMSAAADGERAGLHGAQVGVAAVIASCVWERMLDRVTPAHFEAPSPDPDVAQEMVEKAFAPVDPSGAMARECWADVEKKLAAWDTVDRASAAKTWETLAPRLATDVRDPEVIIAALDAVGSATRFSRLDPHVDAERARWAVASAPLMRNRFTVVDLALLTGCWGEEDVEAVLARAASVGAGL